MKMKIGGANFPYARAPFERFLDDMVELEIQDVDPLLLRAAPLPGGRNSRRPRWRKRQLDARELRPVCLTPEQVIYPINIAAREPVIRERSFD